MFIKFLLSGCLLVTVLANQEKFADFKIKFSKSYSTETEHQQRYEIFMNSLQEIQEHNAKFDQGLESWYKAVNQFSDITTEEFRTNYLTLNTPAYNQSQQQIIHESVEEIPGKIDWRTRGCVTEVKNQGACGSCWSFSATGTLEGAYAKKYGKLIEFSEQELVDCSTASAGYNCHGCTNGIVQEALRYVTTYGMVTEQSYPYEEKQSTCRQNGSLLRISGYTDIPRNNEAALKNAVGSVGPVSVAINCDDIKSYGGGVYDNKNCSKSINHMILAVGYDSENGLDYWLMKNQWGTTWGDSGYIKMAMGSNLCGLASQACYPNL